MVAAGGFFGVAVSVPPTSCYLDAQNRTATLALPTTQTPFVWDVAVNDVGSMLNTTTGAITLPFTGIYTFHFSFNVDVSSATHQVITAAEAFNGSTWDRLQYSARQVAVRVGENNQALFTSTNKFTGNTVLRFPVWASAAGVNLQTETPTAGTGFTIPAARLLITGIKTL